MTYYSDLKWPELSNEAGRVARQLKGYLGEGLEAYNEWQNFRDSRTDAVIATELGKTEAEIADLDACYAAFKKTYDFANNMASPVQADHLYAMRKFS